MERFKVSEISVADQQHHDELAFPLVMQSENSNASLAKTCNWIGQYRDDLLDQVQVHGALLFRGFPLTGPEDFDRFVSAFGLKNFPYRKSLSNAVRVNYTPRVFSANEAPCDVTIQLHHEMAQTPVYPRFLFFFCENPAERGGTTPLCRSDILYQQISKVCPEFLRACEDKGLQYSNVMPSENDNSSGMGRSWQKTFAARDRQEAEQRMLTLGYQWEWLDDGCLRATTPVLPAVMEVSSGRFVFFNQLIAAFQGWKDSRNDPGKSIRFGDGTLLDRETVLHIADLAESLTFDLVWQTGDVAMVDNCLTMHARRTFQGTRKILASLVEPRSHSMPTQS